MKRQDLTARRKQVLAAIDRLTKEQGYPPSVREIGEALGLKSTSSVHFHLKALQERGYLTRDGSLTRALRLHNKVDEVIKRSEPVYVPLVGRVAAGEPVLAAENIEGSVPLPEEFVGPNSFLLEVKGDSMIEDGILEGDYVIVTQTSTAENGDTVVALMGDEATVKRFYRHPDHVELRPANSAMAPIYAKDVEIIGRVCGVLRSYKR